jgi:hypothetical protein
MRGSVSRIGLLCPRGPWSVLIHMVAELITTTRR